MELQGECCELRQRGMADWNISRYCVNLLFAIGYLAKQQTVKILPNAFLKRQTLEQLGIPHTVLGIVPGLMYWKNAIC